MNQILNILIKEEKKKTKSFFRFQFTISIIIIFILLTLIIYYWTNLTHKEKISNQLIDRYKIYKLYSPSLYETNTQKKNENEGNDIFGIIEIPKINIYYPVFSHFSEELLKISPCKFYGEAPNKNSNICIAGHNYNNSMFFSNLNALQIRR